MEKPPKPANGHPVHQKSTKPKTRKPPSKVSIREHPSKPRDRISRTNSYKNPSYGSHSKHIGSMSRTNSYRKNDKATDSENNLSDLVSSDSEDERRPWDRQEEKDKMKSYKKKILKRILKNFSMEETIRSFIEATAGSFVIDEKDFSLER